MRPLRFQRLLVLGLALLMAGPLGSLMAASAGATPQPQAITPLSTFHYTERPIDGVETLNLWPQPTHDNLLAAAFSPDGQWALLCGSHNTLVLWDAANRTSRILGNGTSGNLWGVAWSSDSSTALAVGYNGALYEFASGTVTALPPQNATTWIATTWFPGHGFLVVGAGGQMFFLNGSSRVMLNSTVTADLLGVAYDPVGGTALAVGLGGTAVSVDGAGAVTSVTGPGFSSDLRAVSIESDTGAGYVVGAGGALLRYANGTLANESHPALVGDFYDVASLSSAVPSAMAVRNSTVVGSILFHNGTSDRYIQLSGLYTGIDAITYSPTEGYALAAGDYGALVMAWPNGTFVQVSPTSRPQMWDAAWSPDGAVALMVGFNGTVVRYDRLNGSVAQLPPPSPTAFLRGVSFAPNGTQALIVGQDALWRYDRGSDSVVALSVSGLQDFYDVAWQPNGTMAVLVATLGYIGTWDGSSLLRQTSINLFNDFFTVKWHKNAAGTGDYAYAAGGNIAAKFIPPSTVTTATVLGSFFGVGFEGDDVYAVGLNHTIQFYDSNVGSWQKLPVPDSLVNLTFRALAQGPRSDRLLLVGSQSFTGYLNRTGVNRFDAGYIAFYQGAEYNPVTGDPLLVGQALLAYTMKEGTFPNLAPIVNLTSPAPNSNWTTADTISFDASASYDPDDDALSFSWWDNTTGLITTGPSFGAQMGAANHTVTVFVGDGHGHNVTASVMFRVTEAQYAPVIVLDSPDRNLTYKDDQDITFDAAGSYDPNINDTISFTWRSSLDGVFGNDSVVIARLSAGTNTVTLTVRDSTGLATNLTFSLTVGAGDRPPILSVGSPQEGILYYANVPITFDARNSTDPDSASFIVKWFVDSLEVGDGLLLTRTLSQGTHDVIVSASDGEKQSSLLIRVSVSAPLNLPPKFLSLSPSDGATLTGSATLNGTLEADPAGQVLYVDVSIGGGPRLRAQGNLTWSLTIDSRDYADGLVEVDFFAYDGNLTTVVSRNYTISNPFTNTAPTLTVQSPHSGTTLRGLFTLAGTVDDPDAQNLTVEYRTGNGTWTTAVVTSSAWSAPIESTDYSNGPVTFQVRAFDGLNYSDVATLTVIVDNPTSGGGFLPGPGGAAASLAIVAVAVVSTLWKARRRR